MKKPSTHHACAVARPGDTLIIGLAAPASVEDAQAVAEAIKPLMPDGLKVCVIDNVSGFQVIRGEGGN